MAGKTYQKSDYTKAWRVSDGVEVEVPKAWLASGSPFKDGYTKTDPAKAAEKSTTQQGGQSSGQQGGGQS